MRARATKLTTFPSRIRKAAVAASTPNNTSQCASEMSNSVRLTREAGMLRSIHDCPLILAMAGMCRSVSEEMSQTRPLSASVDA
jgi:hypothetical protein